MRRVVVPLAIVAGVAAACAGVTTTASESTPDAGIADARFGVPRDPSSDAERSGCDRQDTSSISVPPEYAALASSIPADDAEISAGRTLFAARCALCHGRDGKGKGPETPSDPPAADLTARRRPDAFLFWRISEGGQKSPFCSGMPSFAFLGTRARWQVVAFVQTLAPPVDGGLADAGAD